MQRTFCLVFGVVALCISSLHAQDAEPAATAATDLADSGFHEATMHAQKRLVKIFGAGIGRSPGYATGIIVSGSGEILTSQGLFLAGDNLRVTLPSGETHQAQVLRRSNELQAAILKIDAATPDFFELPSSPPSVKGDWVLGISNAFKVADGSEGLSVNIGVLSLRTRLDAKRGFNDFPYDGDVYLIDAITSNPGAAGGAVVNTKGELIGMVGKVIEGKSTNTRLNYALPADVLTAFVQGKETAPAEAPTTNFVKGELGIRLFSLGGRKSPAYVDRVMPGSAAATAGVKSDDLVVSIDGKIVRDGADFRRLADELAADKEIVLEVKRKEQLLQLKVTPAKAN